MYEYELQQARTADLLRRAEHERLAQEAVRGRRAARREAAGRARAANAADDTRRSAGESVESEPHTRRPRRFRFPRTA